jgi:hypothetical protein
MNVTQQTYQEPTLLYELNDNVLLYIVTDVALDLRHGSNALFNLALTCRSFSRLARPLIPRYISFGIPSHKFKLFKRTLKENPTYGHKVLSLWRDYPDKSLSALNEAQLDSFLRKLPNLCTLGIFQQSRWNGPSSVLGLLSGHQPLQRTLEDLTLRETLATVVDLLRLVLFPHLRRLKVEFVQKMGDCKRCLPAQSLGLEKRTRGPWVGLVHRTLRFENNSPSLCQLFERAELSCASKVSLGRRLASDARYHVTPLLTKANFADSVSYCSNLDQAAARY